MTREQKLDLAAFNEVVAGLCSGIPCTDCPFDDGDVCKMQQWVKQMSIKALQAQAEKTCDIEKSNFSKEQYKLDTDTAYECGYKAGLQAQADGDLISRQALLKLMGEEPFNWTDSDKELQEVEDYRNFRNMVEQLPTVNPQEPCEDAISRQAVLKTLDDMDNVLDEDRTIKNYKELLKECYEVLPSAKPQEPKTGHWKRISMDKYTEHAKHWYRCDRCGKDNLGNTDWCPNCGADMRGDNDEVSN